MFKIECYRFKSKEKLDECFKEYCDWCWGHGFGNCDVCKSEFEKEKAKLKGDIEVIET